MKSHAYRLNSKSKPVSRRKILYYITPIFILFFCFLFNVRAEIYKVESMVELRAFDPLGSPSLANGDLALLVSYHSASERGGGTIGDRGGGWFIWTNSTATDDGGFCIVPTSHSSSGHWERLLNGETANINMWGAIANDSSDDTTAIQNAVNAARTGELLVPNGLYYVSNTIVFPSSLHIRGEGSGNNSRVVMSSGSGSKDIFRTQNADKVLYGGVYSSGGALYNGTNALIDWDHFLIFENLYLGFADTSATGAALAIARPGESHIVRNLYMTGGGYGIRSLGVGAPGLHVQDCKVYAPSIAGYSIESITLADGSTADWNGPVSLVGLSCDGAGTTNNASMIRIYKCVPTVGVYDLKAEGAFGNGVICFWRPASSTTLNDLSFVMGSVRVYGGTWNAVGSSGCDFVVLKSDGLRVPSVYMNDVNLSGARYIIRDDLTGRSIYPDRYPAVGGLVQTEARLPMLYEADKIPGYPARTRLVIGSCARYDLYPPTNGWYRVMFQYGRHLNGSLDIGSYNECSELQVDVDLGVTDANQGAWIDVTRPSRDYSSGHRPHVTETRAGSYNDPVIGDVAFLDIHVVRMPQTGEPITLSMPLAGRDWDSQQLISPTNPTSDDPIPTGYTKYSCVTNSLTR